MTLSIQYIFTKRMTKILSPLSSQGSPRLLRWFDMQWSYFRQKGWMHSSCHTWSSQRAPRRTMWFQSILSFPCLWSQAKAREERNIWKLTGIGYIQYLAMFVFEWRDGIGKKKRNPPSQSTAVEIRYLVCLCVQPYLSPEIGWTPCIWHPGRGRCLCHWAAWPDSVLSLWTSSLHHQTQQRRRGWSPAESKSKC